jgi:cbb3-type cytochrome oxidase maturation protein
VNVIFILIAVSLLVALGFLGLFLWSIRSGQYDDEYTPSVRILFDDEKNIIEEENKPDKNGKKNSKFQIPNSKHQISQSKMQNSNNQYLMTND